MKLGIALRSMGLQSQPDTLLACARAADAAGLADLWVQDHLAIPPDDAEGSGGRYLDPLTTLAWLAAKTERIGVGTGILNLPYRDALPTAKAVATVQELSGGRLRLGVGVGWMDAEFRALGVPRSERGARSDEVLSFLHDAFAHDEVERHGQRFLFLPRPKRPPIYVGGAGEHALRRTARFGEGWLAMSGDVGELADARKRLDEMSQEAGRERLAILSYSGFDPREPERAVERVEALRSAGVDQIVAGLRYVDAPAFEEHLAFLVESVLPAL